MNRTDAVFYLWLAALLLFLPFGWVLSAFTAALFHELCHVAVLKILGGTICKIRVSVTGCVLDAEAPCHYVSFFSTLAGPIGSMALLMLAETFPKIAVCGFIHGFYNLLPILPLDGGRMLHLVLNLWIPGYTEAVMWWTGWSVCGMLFVAAVLCSFAFSWGIIPVVLVLFWIIRMHPRKIPCKPSGIGVQ